MDFSRASYNEKQHRKPQHIFHQPPAALQKRSASTSSYSQSQHHPLKTSPSNMLPGCLKPSVIRTTNSMYKSNTSLDLDLEVGLVEQAMNGMHVGMNDGEIYPSDNQNNFFQSPAATITANVNNRRHHLGHNSARMRDFSGNHGSIVDVLSNRRFAHDDENMMEGNHSIKPTQLRFVFYPKYF